MFSVLFPIMPSGRMRGVTLLGSGVIPSTQHQANPVEGKTWQGRPAVNAALVSHLSVWPPPQQTLSADRAEALTLASTVTSCCRAPQRPVTHVLRGDRKKAAYSCVGWLLVGKHCERKPLGLFFPLLFFGWKRERWRWGLLGNYKRLVQTIPWYSVKTRACARFHFRCKGRDSRQKLSKLFWGPEAKDKTHTRSHTYVCTSRPYCTGYRRGEPLTRGRTAFSLFFRRR